MRKYIKLFYISCLALFGLYILASIIFAEYIFQSDRILGYYGDDSIPTPSLYLPVEGNNKLYLYSTKDNRDLWNDIQRRFFINFLYPDIPGMSYPMYYNFSNLPSGATFKEGELLLSVDSRSTYTRNEWNDSVFSWALWKMTLSFGEPKTFDNLGSVRYFWKKWNESLVLLEYETPRHEMQIRISLQDTRLTNGAWWVITELPKKRSPLLIFSRFGFMKKVWYLDLD